MDYWAHDGFGRALVGYYPHISLELGGDDDDTPGFICLDRDSFRRYSYFIDILLRLSDAGIMSALSRFSERRGPRDSVPQATLLTCLASERTRVAAAGGQTTRQVAR